MEKKILKAVFGDSENQIQSIYGPKRHVVDGLLAQRVLRQALKHFWKNSVSFVEAINSLDILATFASGFNANKYVYFNGNVYVDGYAPKWPGKVFDRTMEILIQSLQKEVEAWDPFIMTLAFAITRKCVYRCEHCYAIETLGKKDVLSLDQLLKIAKEFQKQGVVSISWEGGEPLLRFDELITLLKETSDTSEALIATTAYGLTHEKARLLKEAGLTHGLISLDHYDPDKHNAFRGNKKAFDMAVNGVRIFRENGVLPSIAICATKEIVDNGELYQYLELAKEIGTAFIQVIDVMPSGRYLGRDVMLTNAQLEEIKKFQITANTDPQYRDYPSVQTRALLEDGSLYGCMAGNALCYVDSAGNFQPCVMLQLSFGNVLEEGVHEVYNRMRQHFPHYIKMRCPAQTMNKLIAKEYDKTGSLPVPHTNCTHILDKIQAKDIPDLFRKISEKQKRKRLRDFISR